MSGERVFLSVAGPDRVQARLLKAAMEAAGLTVFLDETGIDVGDGVTATIERELSRSTALLAYYSDAFTSRPACQVELTAAFLAGQREGEPARRVIVVNPLETTSHLAPVELSDTAFAPAPPGAALDDVARRIAARVARIRGRIGDARLMDRPAWHGRGIPGSHEFVGRYPLLWDLHSALHRIDYPLTQEPTLGPVAAVAGLAGIGKTSLVAAYAWLFGTAFPGGVYWTSLAGVAADVVPERYAERLRTMARDVGVEVEERDDADVRRDLVRQIASRGRCLWVVDDVPGDLDPRRLDGLVLEAAAAIRTVVVSRDDAFRDVVRSLPVPPMSAAEGGAILERFRPMHDDAAERRARDEIVARVGGHPLALRVLGARLAGTQELLSYRQLAGRLPRGVDALDAVTAVIQASVADLPPGAQLVLRVSAACAPVAVPARVISRAVADLTGAAADDVVDALHHLDRRRLADPDGGSWLVHPLVAAAAVTGGSTLEVTAAVAAAVLAEVAAARGDAARQQALVPHAVALAEEAALAADTSAGLWRFLTGWYAATGNPPLEARAWNRLRALAGGTPADLAAAARAHHAAGDHQGALRLAERAVSAATEGGPATVGAELVRAEALDALGLYDDAEPVWSRLVATSAEASTPAEEAALRLALVRRLRRRGPMRDALEAVRLLVADARLDADPDAAETRQIARIELARLQLLTDAQQAARATAADVIAHYKRLGRPQHARAQEAREVLAEARLTPQLTELNADPARWVEAERDLARMVAENREEYGAQSSVALTCAVVHGYALVCLGRAREARTELTATRDEVARQLGTRHPLWLRATFYLAQASGQLRERDPAVRLYRAAFEGQLSVLGPVHPDTLKSQYGLGVGLVLTGRKRAGMALLREVRRLAPRSVGRGTDLYGQAVAAIALGPLPSGLWRLVDRWTGHRD